MDTLSRAVAETVRRELAGRKVDWADYAKTVGMPKTTVWRKLNGTSKITIDDTLAFAMGLGWTLPQLVSHAETLTPASPAVEKPSGQDRRRAKAREKGRALLEAEDPGITTRPRGRKRVDAADPEPRKRA